ncbi:MULTISPECIES: DJ-1 family glyoxalase III [unclassified Gemella]|uniref:DJ-1 family glyoxalase III n=1 Tax=unclassified Gemella TaxID=2624949 RepID=UPI0010733FF8|nr:MULTISPECIES: DJ-1 family glyoxalase III [unclassified Gemella]MBF0710772.1 DJ-1/PfpI family protein [Gemella sp. GL1.1]MBF0746659.1 DJ-1/PfpI family protein [Gemella sp. 19428wG2_WT2a]NYS28116.1 DJ-1/PfpI family protein [Gemella sp. GL1]TFU60011.1 DJ-1/PfpI family protein [Gemella sp. WT2a]
MTKKIAVLADNGFEEIELLTPIDVLRRAGLKVDLISANNAECISSSRNVKILVDKKINDINSILDYDAIFIPGGMPGAENLKNNERVIEFFQEMNKAAKLVSAICAAPIVLDKAGLTQNKNITCYPGFENSIDFKSYSESTVIVDGNMITASGPGLALDFSLKLLTYLTNEETSNNIAKAMLKK